MDGNEVIRSEDTSTPSRTRRGFLGTLIMIVGLLLSYGTALVYGLQFLYPRRRTNARQRIYITSVEELRRDGVRFFADLQGREVILAESKEGFRALSTTCTHLGCRVYWEPEKPRFFCPCHMGVFDVNGNVVSGPPPEPLRRYDVEEEKGSIYVIMEG